jgi:hypothetical protein
MQAIDSQGVRFIRALQILAGLEEKCLITPISALCLEMSVELQKKYSPPKQKAAFLIPKAGKYQVLDSNTILTWSALLTLL